MKKRPIRLSDHPGLLSISASVVSILIGLLFGFLLLLILNPRNALSGMGNLLGKGITDFGNVLYRAAPLVMVGLSVAFAYKVSLFNIGASGQYTVGAFLALTFAIEFQMPWYVCLLVAMVGGAFWGLFPGLFKALFNVNEVLTAIMFNWIGMNLVNFLIPNMPKMLDSDWGASASDRTANLTNANPSAILPRLGLDKLFHYNYMNIGFFLAILMAVILWVVLKKTTFGYELKAVGLNKSAARYAGINEKKNIILSMAIAGALAGFGAGLFYLSNVGQWNPLNSTSLPAMGFNGISVALLASSNPIGTIFSALFISHISVGGTFLSTKYYPTEIADLISGIIIYLCAFSMLFRGKIQSLLFKNAEKTNVNAEPAPAKPETKKEGK